MFFIIYDQQNRCLNLVCLTRMMIANSFHLDVRAVGGSHQLVMTASEKDADIVKELC